MAKTVVIPGDVFGGRKFTQNDVDGGYKRVDDFGFDGKTFWGGNVKFAGLNTGTGLWLLVQNGRPIIRGVMVQDGRSLTQEGKALVKSHTESREADSKSV